MKILRNFVVTGGLLRSNGDQAQVGDTVRLYPYEGESFLATIEAVAPVNCGADRAYAIEYNLDVVLRVCDLQDRGDVLDCCALLEERVEVLEGKENIEPYLIRSSISQVIALNTGFTEIVYDRLVSNQGDIDEDGNVVVPRAGWYQIAARLSFDSPYTASRAVITVKNAGTSNLLTSEVSCSGSISVLEVEGVKFLGKNNLIAAETFLNGGSVSTLDPDVAIYESKLSTLTLSEMNPITPVSDRKIVGVGDSIMRGATSGPDNVAIEFLSSNTVNFGQDGVNTTYLAGIQAQVISEANLNADLVIHITVNDLAIVVSPNISAIVDRLEAFVNAVSSLYRRVVWITPPPSVYLGQANYANYPNDRIALINAVVARNIPNLLIARTDLDPAIGVSGRQFVVELYPDLLHPSALGQYYISKVIEPLLA